MDKLSKQLKGDAQLIDAEISDELDRRISASLNSVTPEKPPASKVRQRPALFWLASSLTGIAAALAVIAIVNSGPQQSEVPPAPIETSPVAVATMPTIRWKTESAMLTRPLQQELEDLQSDLRKAEEKVKEDIGL